MARNNENADHQPNLDGNAPGEAGNAEHYKLGASDRAHGTHGRGGANETRVDETVVEPDAPRKADSGITSDASFGSAASGGSTVDKRPPQGHKQDKRERNESHDRNESHEQAKDQSR